MFLLIHGIQYQIHWQSIWNEMVSGNSFKTNFELVALVITYNEAMFGYWTNYFVGSIHHPMALRAARRSLEAQYAEMMKRCAKKWRNCVNLRNRHGRFLICLMKNVMLWLCKLIQQLSSRYEPYSYYKVLVLLGQHNYHEGTRYFHFMALDQVKLVEH